MDYERVQASLRQIGKIYDNILDDSHHYVLAEAVSGVKTSKETYESEKTNKERLIAQMAQHNKEAIYEIPHPWGYTIDHDNPLRFKVSPIRDLKLQVDIYCDIRWKDEDLPFKQDIKVRVWSYHDDTIFRGNRDAEEILDELFDKQRKFEGGRVVSRFHLDKVNERQELPKDPHKNIIETSPKYHLQFGGIPKDYELCWHPEKVNVPRLLYQPMELFLTCQLVAASFFYEEYQEIKKKNEWIGELLLYQNTLLRDYYANCLDIISMQKSLLDNLSV